MVDSDLAEPGLSLSIVDQVIHDPLLLNEESIREQVRLLPTRDYNRLWDLYIRTKGMEVGRCRG